MSRRRKREELELRLVGEWAASVHPRARKLFRCWLGPLPPEAADAEAQGFNPAMYQVVGKWADCVILYPTHTLIVEGKFKLTANALGQILVYNDLFPQTPHLKDHWNKPRELLCVYAIGDDQVKASLEQRGILCHRYYPEWATKAYVTRARRTYRR